MAYGTRAGDNLFTLERRDRRDGNDCCHFQQVHHDIWDYDATSSVVSFDVKVDGTVRHAIAEAGKTGWLYMLDHTDGKPLYGIIQKAAPQNSLEHTAKTQPLPDNAILVTHTVSTVRRSSPSTPPATSCRHLARDDLWLFGLDGSSGWRAPADPQRRASTPARRASA